MYFYTTLRQYQVGKKDTFHIFILAVIIQVLQDVIAFFRVPEDMLSFPIEELYHKKSI